MPLRLAAIRYRFRTKEHGHLLLAYVLILYWQAQAFLYFRLCWIALGNIRQMVMRHCFSMILYPYMEQDHQRDFRVPFLYNTYTPLLHLYRGFESKVGNVVHYM